MAKPYSQDLRDRVIDAVKRGEMSRRAAARRYEISESVAIKWLGRIERDGSREPAGHGGHRASKLMAHRDFLEACGPRNRTSRFRFCAIAFRPSEGSKPTPR
jgi:transposase